MKRRLYAIRHRLEWATVATAAFIVPLLSRRMCWWLGRLIGAIISVVDRRGRQVALSNLEATLGNEFSAHQRKNIVRHSYQNFATAMIDLLWSPRLTRENFRRYIELENVQRAEEQSAD